MTYPFYAGLLFAMAAFLTGYGESFNSIFRAPGRQTSYRLEATAHQATPVPRK